MVHQDGANLVTEIDNIMYLLDYIDMAQILLIEDWISLNTELKWLVIAQCLTT